MSEDGSARDRAAYFRSRWAQDHFTSQTSLPTDRASSREQEKVDPGAQLLVPAKKLQRKSWLRSFSRSTQDQLNILRNTNRTPLSNGSSIRSPVDSEGHTIFSHQQQPMTDPEQQPTDESPKLPDWLNELYVLSWLAFFSMLGTLARVGVEAITQYPDEVVTSRVLWANLGGSFIMGFLAEDRNLFGIPAHLASPAKGDEPPDEPVISAAHLKHKKTIPMYIGLTTGFCGSFTSFSSFIRDAFLALTNDLPSSSATTPYHAPAHAPYPRNGGYSVLALLAILILHPAVALTALRMGAHVAMLCRSVLVSTRVAIHPRFRAKLMDPLIAFVGIGCFIGALFLTIFPPKSGPSPVNWRARATIPLLWAPPGCFLRYYLAKFLNTPARPHFPLGTFLANIIGTFVLGMAFDLQHTRSIGAVSGLGDGNACAVLAGVEEGFCGCLSTVSTWVVELYGLRLKSAWIYGLTSVAVSLAGMVVIMGSVGWTSGFQNPVCG